MNRPPTILVLRALGLGDLITGLPALRLLRDAYPRHRIVLAAPRRWAPVLELAGTVDAMVEAHELSPIDSPPERPELAIDLHGNGPASRRLLEPSRPRRILAYSGGPVTWRQEEHEVERWCRLLVEGLPLPGADVPGAGVPGVRGMLGPPPDATMSRGRTVVHCGAAFASRRWPPTRFAALALLLAGEGHDVVVTGGPGERDLAERVALAANVPAETDLDLPALLSLIGHARLVLSGDTGIAHVAAAYGTPSVTLFGPVSPRRWGPPESPRHQVVWRGDGTGDPHGGEPDPALMAITVGEVVAAVHTAESAMRLARA